MAHIPVILAAILATIAAAFAAGLVFGRPEAVRAPSAAEIRQAQQRLDAGLPQAWVRMFAARKKLQHLRDRGYAYCYRQGGFDADCGRQQDKAVQDIFYALLISDEQRSMKDRSSLSLREYEVAANPRMAADIRRYCWTLFVEHGGRDLRILSTCLGNLTGFSPLVKIPAP